MTAIASQSTTAHLLGSFLLELRPGSFPQPLQSHVHLGFYRIGDPLVPLNACRAVSCFPLIIDPIGGNPTGGNTYSAAREQCVYCLQSLLEGRSLGGGVAVRLGFEGQFQLALSLRKSIS